VNIVNKLNKAQQFLLQSRFIDADNELNKVLKKVPNNFQALALKSVISIKINDKHVVIKNFKKALDNYFDLNLGLNFVQYLIENKELNLALDINNKILTIDNHNQIARLNQAKLNIMQNSNDIAFDRFKQLILDFPDFISGYISYGYNLNRLKRYDDAIQIYKKGLEKFPKDFNLIFNLGISLNNNQDFNEALKYLESAYNLNSKDENLILTLLACYIKSGLFKKARELINKLEKIIKTHNNIIPFQRGTIEMNEGNYEVAIKYFKYAINKDYDDVESHFNLGLVYLKKFDYENVDSEYRFRMKRTLGKKYGLFDDFKEEKITQDDDVLISKEQGIGDEILFVRLLPSLLSNFKSISYICDDRLKDILEINLSQINIIPLSLFHKESGEKYKNYKKINLGTIFRFINPNDCLKSIPFWLPANQNKFLPEKSNRSKIRIGISWKSNNENIGKRKSLNLQLLYDALSLNENNELINLQYGDISKEIKSLKLKNKKEIIVPEIDYFNDINNLFSLVNECDLVVTTSNVTAHIAGALGKKTFLLLPKRYGRIWYWNTNENRSPWYQSIKFIEQEEDQSWDSCIKKIKLETLN